MIVSYETFRIHAERFQAEGTCDLLICDEVGGQHCCLNALALTVATPCGAPPRRLLALWIRLFTPFSSPPPHTPQLQAHRLKNDATLTNRALDSLACRRRVLLSGTPLQNRLDEFYGGCLLLIWGDLLVCCSVCCCEA